MVEDKYKVFKNKAVVWDAFHSQLRVDDSTKVFSNSQSLCGLWSCASIEFIAMASELETCEVFNSENIKKVL